MKTAALIAAAFAFGIAVSFGIGGIRNAGRTPPVVTPPVVEVRNQARKRIGLVAHDALKGELLAWVEKNASVLAEHELYSTGTTGRLATETLARALPGKEIRLTRFNSGPLGGDLQMGALVSQGGLDILFFFVDPMTAHPHDADIKALLRMCGVYNTVLAITPATADFVIASPLFAGEYAKQETDHSSYVNRQIK